MKKHTALALFATIAATAAFIEPSLAASQFDPLTAATLETDLTDTLQSIVTWVLKVMFTLGGIWFVVGMVGKGLSRLKAKY